MGRNRPEADIHLPILCPAPDFAGLSPILTIIQIILVAVAPQNLIAIFMKSYVNRTHDIDWLIP
jgi:hypothetical protein